MQRLFKRLPNHVGIIPDGNRRWAQNNGLAKEMGYQKGLEPGIELYKICVDLGIKELTYYGFTQDNTKRPAVQREAFKKACIDAVKKIANYDAALLVIGNTDSQHFPQELLPYTKKRVVFGKGLIKVNFLVNYSWQWDLGQMYNRGVASITSRNISDLIASSDVSRIDLIVRWGDRRRLSGFLPVQTIYSDFYVVDEMWPDFKPEQFYNALRWYETQDVTLGG